MAKKMFNLLIIASILLIAVPVASAAPPPQEEGLDYTVVADDWLSLLAEKYLGNLLAYPAIVSATNAKAAEDSSYAAILDPDERKEIYKKIVEIVILQDMPLIKVQAMPRYAASNYHVQGGYVNAKGYFAFTDYLFVP